MKTAYPKMIPLEYIPEAQRDTGPRAHRHEWTTRSPETPFQQACRAIDEAEAETIKAEEQENRCRRVAAS